MIFRHGVKPVLFMKLPEAGGCPQYYRHRVDFLLRSRSSATLPTPARCWVRIQFVLTTRVKRSLAPAPTPRPVGLIRRLSRHRRRSLSGTWAATPYMDQGG